MKKLRASVGRPTSYNPLTKHRPPPHISHDSVNVILSSITPVHFQQKNSTSAFQTGRSNSGKGKYFIKITSRLQMYIYIYIYINIIYVCIYIYIKYYTYKDITKGITNII